MQLPFVSTVTFLQLSLCVMYITQLPPSLKCHCVVSYSCHLASTVTMQVTVEAKYHCGSCVRQVSAGFSCH